MKEFDNFVYFDVCLFAIDEFNKLNVNLRQSSFYYYCVCMKDSLLQEHFNRKLMEQIASISRNIQLIYGLDTGDSVNYITNFFVDELYKTFAEPALMIKHYFRNSFL